MTCVNAIDLVCTLNEFVILKTDTSYFQRYKWIQLTNAVVNPSWSGFLKSKKKASIIGKGNLIHSTENKRKG